MLSFQEVKNNPQIKEFIKQSDLALRQLGFTDHAFRHSQLVSSRAASIARKIGLSKREQELAAIAGYCHDMGNFLGRQQHHYWGGLLFHQIYQSRINQSEIKDLIIVTQAMVGHDKIDIKILNKVTATVILADKSDVHRSRVLTKSIKKIKEDIHNRVNYAVTKSDLLIKPQRRKVLLRLMIDTQFIPIIEYFEIFIKRMAYCRQAADFINYQFGLEINKFKFL